MSEKHPGPLVVEGKLTDAERMKLESNYLRGTIAEDLNDGLTGGFKGDNFLLIRFPNEPGRTAKDADEFLMKRGLILRQVASYGLPDHLRLSVGIEEANRAVVAALAEFLGRKP